MRSILYERAPQECSPVRAAVDETGPPRSGAVLSFHFGQPAERSWTTARGPLPSCELLKKPGKENCLAL